MDRLVPDLDKLVPDLDKLVPDVLAHDVDDPPAVGGEELVRPLVEGDDLEGGERD